MSDDLKDQVSKSIRNTFSAFFLKGFSATVRRKGVAEDLQDQSALPRLNCVGDDIIHSEITVNKAMVVLTGTLTNLSERCS